MHLSTLILAAVVGLADNDGCRCCSPAPAQASADREVDRLRRENAKLKRKVAQQDEENRNLKLRIIRMERSEPRISSDEYLRRLQTPHKVEDGDVIIPAG